MFDKIDFQPGIVFIEWYKNYDFNKTLEEQDALFALDEDWFAVRYPNELLLDVGWYGDIDNLSEGTFGE